MLVTEKQCKCCGEWWPADAEFFAPRSDSCDGLANQCRACNAAQRMALRHARAAQVAPTRASDTIAPLLTTAQFLGGCRP